MKSAEKDIIEFERKEILERNFDPSSSPWKDKVVMFVLQSQGIIDDGGFEYFFEIPFDGKPDLNEFVVAFEEVRAKESSEALKKALEIHRTGSTEFGDLADFFFKESDENYLKLEMYILESNSNT